MKRRHPEGQRSIQSYFQQPAKRAASDEGHATEENADAAAPDLQSESGTSSAEEDIVGEAVESATSSADEEIVGEAVDQPLLEAAGTCKAYFTDIGECWKGYSAGGLPQWNPVPRNLPDTDKISVIENHCAPQKDFIFPVRVQTDGKQRRFQRSWLEEFPWIVYSPACNGGFCLPCVMFAPDDPKLGQLYRSPLENFTRFKTACNRHAEQNIHKNALAKFSHFKSQVRSNDIVQQLVDVNSTQSEENMQKLRGIVETVIVCGKQNIPLRAHRNELYNPGRDEQVAGNPGNFLALMDFRAGAGDASVSRSFHKKPGGGRSIKYTTPRIQNQLVECCGDDIRKQILDEVKKSPFFTVLADEATDASNTEQMAIVLRYLDSTFQVTEAFLSFVACSNGTTGEALANEIKTQLLNWGLDMTKLRGQGYDGAGNMAGDIRGCAARITAEYPKALYLHCCSHALNLCIMAASKINSVAAMWTTLREVSFFFNSSPKRQQKLSEVITASTPDEVKARKLTDLCRTRWSARHTALVTFAALMKPVIRTLEEISSAPRTEWNSNTAGQASAFLKSLLSFDFIAAFGIVSEVMSIIQSLTSSLQEASLDIVQAYRNVGAVHQQLKDAREKVTEQHGKWWATVISTASDFDITPSTPRTCGRQQHRANAPAATPQQYYERTLTIPMLDELSGHMESKFSKHQRTAGMGLSLLPASIVKSPATCKVAALAFATEYESDLPGDQSLSSFSAELDRWIALASTTAQADLPSSVPDALLLAQSTLSPCILRLLSIVAVLPATSCSCERSISSLRRLKTYLRSTMTNHRLCGLALLHVHYTRQVNVESVIRQFLLMAPRNIIAPVSATSVAAVESSESDDSDFSNDDSE
ncbi:52 kDa repressor of the inhibitor of the protein kinase-like [Sycon ciliatum]|uniref:52 kDa repressor of the inhibitor of the protein kinase-like n=1 Tax=Sycon ciliatum TaxID=27933 RepID=UPI0031F6D1A5